MATIVAAIALTILAFMPPGAAARPSTVRAASGLPPLPAHWPATLQLGLADAPGGAAALRASAPFGFRYQYLAGGVNTGAGWATWNPGGTFASSYVRDSLAHHVVPVLTYYMIRQSEPGSGQTEAAGDLANLSRADTMRAYFRDLELLFRRVHTSAGSVVVHVEPDLWGYGQQRAVHDDASSVRAAVASTGLPELEGLPNTLAGFAQAVVRLRDRLAPYVLLGYHLSVWGTGVDVALSDPPAATVDRLAARASAFYASLHARFDVAFAEFSDRDAAFKQIVTGDGGASWWRAGDFGRNVRFLGRFVALTGRRVVLWQIPLGNTRMRAMDNTWGHFQDNRVQWLLDDPSRTHLLAYARAGVIAFLFGGGADGTTCACDARHDGVTNPAPIDGNDALSLSADDDGGFFHARAAAYYRAGPIRLDASLQPAAAPAIPSAVAPPGLPAAAPGSVEATTGPVASGQRRRRRVCAHHGSHRRRSGGSSAWRAQTGPEESEEPHHGTQRPALPHPTGRGGPARDRADAGSARDRVHELQQRPGERPAPRGG